MRASEIGLLLNWRVGPAGAEFSDARFATVQAAGGMRARLPLSPVHLRAKRKRNGDLAISWIRRGRSHADDSDPAKFPWVRSVRNIESILPMQMARRSALSRYLSPDGCIRLQ